MYRLKQTESHKRRPSVISRTLCFFLFVFFSNGSSTFKYKRKRVLQDFILQASLSKTYMLVQRPTLCPLLLWWYDVLFSNLSSPLLSNDSLNKPFLLRTKQKFSRFLLQGVDGYVVANRTFWFCSLFTF